MNPSAPTDEGNLVGSLVVYAQTAYRVRKFSAPRFERRIGLMAFTDVGEQDKCYYNHLGHIVLIYTDA